MDDVVQQQILLAFEHHGSLHWIAVDDGNALSGVTEQLWWQISASKRITVINRAAIIPALRLADLCHSQ